VGRLSLGQTPGFRLSLSRLSGGQVIDSYKLGRQGSLSHLSGGEEPGGVGTWDTIVSAAYPAGGGGPGEWP